MDHVRLYVDAARIGCGMRAFVVIESGRKWARLVEPTTGARLKLPVAELRHVRPVERPRWRRIARQLRRADGDDRALKRLAAETGRAP